MDQPAHNPSSSDSAERRVGRDSKREWGWVREKGRERGGGVRVVLCTRWVWVLCSVPGSVQSFSLSLPGAAARVHTAEMTSKAAFSALGPVG